MPAIKKRITAEYLGRERLEQNGQSLSLPEGGEGEENTPRPPLPPSLPLPTSSMGVSGTGSGQGTAPPGVKRKQTTGANLMKGLDGEVLAEKRKRTLPPAEQKLDAWMDENFEKRPESHLSVKKLYQLYTDLCQQDSAAILELDVFRHMLVNKFGKECGVRETSAYSGLLKETKPRKKPVVAPSLGYKLKDLVHEALKASGNPTKGVMFSWVKKFISGKYPALQIELKPHFLRSALQRELYSGRVELVKGIGFCGFYRLPGPPHTKEEPKSKKTKMKKKTEEGEAESAEDSVDIAEEKSDDSSADKSDSKLKKKMTTTTTTTTDTEDSMQETTGEEKEEKKGDEKDKKATTKKKKRRPAKPRRRNGAKHGAPQTLNDIFPLAITYMAEPKEASFARIKKYLEKYYDKVDIDNRLKRCMEQGCQSGTWDRVSGSGASGSFQLQVDSFNPQHTESLTDMVCSAIIACTEPKISSVRLLKNYITEYHPEFNILSRPVRLRLALEKAERQNQLRRISGIGMSGSFQLVDQFTPSPAILAGEDDDDDEFNDEEFDGDYLKGAGKAEVYVVRKTKSGRQAPITKTQVDFSPTYRKNAQSAKSGTKRKTSVPKRTYSEGTSSEEEEEEEEEDDEEEEEEERGEYKPRPTKSRGGGGRGRLPAPSATKKMASPSSKSRKSAPPAAAAAAATARNRSSMAKRGRTEKQTTATAAATATTAATTATAATPSTPRRKTQTKGRQVTTTTAAKTARRALPPRRKDEDDEEEEEEEAPSPSPSPPPPPPRSAVSSRRVSPLAKKSPSNKTRGIRGQNWGRGGGGDEEEEEEDEVEVSASRKKPSTPTQRGRMTKSQQEEEEEEEDASLGKKPAKRPRGVTTSAERKSPTKKTQRSYWRDDDSENEDDETDDDENYYEVEEEGGTKAQQTSAQRRTAGGGVTTNRTATAATTPVTKSRHTTSSSRKGGGLKERESKSSLSPASQTGRTPRSASRTALKSLKEIDYDEVDDDDEDDDEEEGGNYDARSSRKKR